MKKLILILGIIAAIAAGIIIPLALAEEKPSLELLQARASAIQWEAEAYAARIEILKRDYASVQALIAEVQKPKEEQKQVP